MQDGIRAAGMLRAGGVGAENVVLREGDETRVFHRAEVVFGHKDGIVLAPRVGVVKVLVEKVHTLGSKVQDFFVEVLKHGRARKGAQLCRVAAIRGGPRALLILVRACREGSQVGRQRRCRREGNSGEVTILTALDFRLVREDLPLLRCGHAHVEDGLEIRLLEAGEDAASIGRLEV